MTNCFVLEQFYITMLRYDLVDVIVCVISYFFSGSCVVACVFSMLSAVRQNKAMCKTSET